MNSADEQKEKNPSSGGYGASASSLAADRLASANRSARYWLAGTGPRTVGQLAELLDGMDKDLPADQYGTGEIIESFQGEMAALLGKEAAVFFPSGTMAQQIAMRIWCDRKGTARVAYHPLCHLEIHEQDGLKKLHGIQPVLLGAADRLIAPEDVRGMQEEVSCLLLELPQREIGGELPAWAELEELAALCRERGIPLHLDGARLFEALPYYGKTAAEVCALFDSVYISFYKGLAGIAGAVLAGDAKLTEEAKIWKRRHGGDLISLYPYFLSGKAALDRRLPRMNHYWQGARKLAAAFNRCPGLSTRPAEPVTNMFHVHTKLAPGELEAVLAEVTEETGVVLARGVRPGRETAYFELSVGDSLDAIPEETRNAAFDRLAEKLAERLPSEGR
ncbi:threonine aldolase family protein [Paenibacillus glufosinatiresistens]|uniref:threonine aldolase family protein n=1 Tax=Paenibacillus glufosinatiresistens TaxID=3070657 RepID=UPI00286DF113|nr:beta-eliminating lyase-related protein [Paenibacillus sp. YX.27]